MTDINTTSWSSNEGWTAGGWPPVAVWWSSLARVCWERYVCWGLTENEAFVLGHAYRIAQRRAVEVLGWRDRVGPAEMAEYFARVDAEREAGTAS